MYSDTDEKLVSQQWNEWVSIAHCMESSIRKAAKTGLGKDKVKVQAFLNSGTYSYCVCYIYVFSINVCSLICMIHWLS